jgi:hypothetical protein
MNAQGVKPLTGAEIQELFSNAKENSKNSKYEYEGFYSADGKTKTRVWGLGGRKLTKVNRKLIVMDICV